MSESMAEEARRKKCGTFRGHPIAFINDQWVYVDTLKPTPGYGGEQRPCKLCGSEKWSNDGHVDECLGVLPGVTNACCGHGDPDQSYVVFNTGIVLRNFIVAEPTSGPSWPAQQEKENE